MIAKDGMRSVLHKGVVVSEGATKPRQTAPAVTRDAGINWCQTDTANHSFAKNFTAQRKELQTLKNMQTKMRKIN